MFLRTMLHVVGCVLLVVFTVGSPWATSVGQAQQETTEKQQKKIELPEDPNAVIVELRIALPKIEPPESGKEKEKSKKSGEQSGETDKQGNASQDDGNQNAGGNQNSSGQDASGQNTTGQNTTDQNATGLGTQQDQNKNQDQDGPGETQKEGELQPPTVAATETRTVPRIQIFADGRVQCGVMSSGMIAGRTKLSDEQLQEVMNAIVHEQNFFAATEEKIKAELEGKKDEMPSTKGMANYKILVATRDRRHEVSVSGLRELGKRFKDLNVIQNVFQVERNLNQMFVSVSVGGKTNLDRIIGEVNAKLKRARPDGEEFDVDDINFVGVRANGSMRVTFSNSVFKKGQIVEQQVATFIFDGKRTRSSVYFYRD